MFPNSASHGLHNPPKINSLHVEAIHHSQKALKDQNIGRVHHLKDKTQETKKSLHKQNAYNFSVNKLKKAYVKKKFAALMENTLLKSYVKLRT